MTEHADRLAAALADRYRIEGELGQGGMATVYLAQDVRHDRKVAVKVLRPELAAVLGADRFIQEIKTTAQLQHPHILPLFDSGQANGFLYYVMPYVEGETLRDMLTREGQLGIEQAVNVASEVADALDHAHRQGVIHRDIKPENILLHDGRPMVADFGIALAVSAAAGGRMTETGMSLGTPHYMSPEQATAEKEITARSDVYSLGSVLYEMLTGEPPHMGNSAQAIIMKIVTEDAQPVTRLRKSVPPHVAAATAKALERLPADRFDSAKAFAEALHNPAFTTVGSGGAAAPIAVPPSRRTATRLALATGVLAAVLLVTTLVGWFRTPPGPVSRNAIVLPGWTGGPGALAWGAAVAPDGSGIVYVDSSGGTPRLVLKRRDQLDVTSLAGTDGASGPFFSPDGTWIGFFAAGKLRKIPMGGGGSIALADWTGPLIPSGTWSDDGTILFVDGDFSLGRVSDAGGTSEVVVRGGEWGGESDLPDPTRLVVHISPLPGARGALFTGCDISCNTAAVFVYDAGADTVRLLFDEAFGVWYVPTGHVVYIGSDGGAFAAPFDLGRLRVTGAAVPVLERVRPPELAFGRDGTLLYVMGTGGFLQAGGMAEVVWVDRGGVVTSVGMEPFQLPQVSGLAVSPDGSRLAVGIQAGGADNIWIKHLRPAAGPLSRLTFGGEGEILPRWSPDGASVLFSTVLAGADLYMVDAEGLGAPTKLADLEVPITAGRWSPDGQWILIRPGRGGANVRDIWAFRPGVDSVPTLLVDEGFDEISPAVSPDGRWLAYTSNATGRHEVYVKPFPAVETGKWQVSAQGGRGPLWARDGRELFYINAANELVAVEVVAGTTFGYGTQRVLFSVAGAYVTGVENNVTSYDVSPDGERFVFLRRVGDVQGTAGSLILVENWFEELRARVKGAR